MLVSRVQYYFIDKNRPFQLDLFNLKYSRTRNMQLPKQTFNSEYWSLEIYLLTIYRNGTRSGMDSSDLHNISFP